MNDFLIRTGLRSGTSKADLPYFTITRAEIALIIGITFSVRYDALISRAGGTADGDRSHRDILKTPSYAKSVR